MSGDVGKMSFIGTVSGEPFQANENGKPVLMVEVSQGNNRIFCQLRGDYRIRNIGPLKQGDRVWGTGDLSLENINGQQSLAVSLDDLKPLSSNSSGGWNGGYQNQSQNSYQNRNSGYGNRRRGWGN